jgi:ABC-2 type transport system ATP-binding protein
VTILFTSHNLAEVETLCRRVAIISRGSIRAIDTPGNLRRLTAGLERVQVTAKMSTSGLTFDGVEIENKEDGLTQLSFMREPSDRKLDQLIRRLHETGGQVIDVETERPTLLDVLEIYENESGGSASGATD